MPKGSGCDGPCNHVGHCIPDIVSSGFTLPVSKRNVDLPQALQFFTLKKMCICKESYYISVQNNTVVHTSSYVHRSRGLVPQGTHRYSDSQILRVQCVGVYVYIKLRQGESVVENCTWKVLATHTCRTFQFLIHAACGCLWSPPFCFLFAVLVILAIGEQNLELVNCVRMILMSLPVFVSKPV